MSSGPKTKTRTRVKAGAIARARKPSGRLNTDDFKSAQKAIATTPKKELIKELEKNRKRKAIISRYLALQKKEKPSSREIQHRENAVAKKRRTLGFTTGKQTGVAMHHPKSEPKINKAYKLARARKPSGRLNTDDIKGASKNLKRKK
tara:strand:+ start:1035 stop:1475 length:441 start_codon:yes stop_codon:yes gene_type:complete